MTYQIFLDDPPENTPPELSAWLTQQFLQIQDALQQRLDLDTELQLDQKPIDGMFRYIVNGPEGAGFYGRLNNVWIKFGASGDVLIGYYDVDTQLVNGGAFDGQPLPAATATNDRDYMVIEGNGTLITPNAPEINGEVVGFGDVIRSFGGLWYLESYSTTYLSSVVDDAAQGHITLVKTPIDTGHAAQLGQVNQVQANLDVHVGHTAAANDVHGTRTYTDAGDAAHAALQASPDDVHGTKTYADAGDATVQSNLDTHIGHTAAANDVHGSKTYADQQDAAHAALQANPDDVHGTKTYTDAAIQAHEDDPDPHPQYQIELPGYVLYGPCNNFTLDSTSKRLEGYVEGGQYNDESNLGGFNQSTGEITIPWDGVYNITAWVYGTQGNDNKEEWIELRARVNGTNEVTIDVLEVPTDKTNRRSLKVSFTRFLNQGDLVTLWLWASTGLGTFTFINTTFELSGRKLDGWTGL